MRARIHRGAHEIGGSCVEVEEGGERVVLDVGRPLDAERGAHVPLPDVTGFVEADPNLRGVVITHAHQDHWGLAEQLPPGTPLYLGEATASILREAAFWSAGLAVEPTGHLVHRQPFELGPFTITPFLNDHSAFDAYSLLVQSGGRILFYTGDIRGHGRKWGIFEELLRKPPHPVDVLLMEGTNIRPSHEEIALPPLTESEVEDACVDTFRSTGGMALVVFSAQNIDRLVTIYRAAKRSGRTLVVDLYTARIAASTGNPNIPRPGPEWPNVKVFVPLWQRVKVKEAGAFNLVSEVRPFRLFEEDLAAKPSHFVSMFTLQSGPRFLDAGCLDGARLVWSLWSGYLREGSGKALRAFLEEHGIPMVQHHTSGHASIADLKRLAAALAPKRVVPIHTFAGERYADHFDGVEVHADGSWWNV